MFLCVVSDNRYRYRSARRIPSSVGRLISTWDFRRFDFQFRKGKRRVEITIIIKRRLLLLGLGLLLLHPSPNLLQLVCIRSLAALAVVVASICNLWLSPGLACPGALDRKSSPHIYIWRVYVFPYSTSALSCRLSAGGRCQSKCRPWKLLSQSARFIADC